MSSPASGRGSPKDGSVSGAGGWKDGGLIFGPEQRSLPRINRRVYWQSGQEGAFEEFSAFVRRPAAEAWPGITGQGRPAHYNHTDAVARDAVTRQDKPVGGAGL
jgi:hypothetical protein